MTDTIEIYNRNTGQYDVIPLSAYEAWFQHQMKVMPDWDSDTRYYRCGYGDFKTDPSIEEFKASRK